MALIRALNPTEDLGFTTASTLYRLATSGPSRLSDLAISEGVTQPAMTQLISRLERQGLAERRGEPSDRRVVMVHVTPMGRQVLRDRQAYRANRMATLLAELPEADEHIIAAALPALGRLADLVCAPVLSSSNGSTRP